MKYSKPNGFSNKYVVPTELRPFLCLFSTDISLLTELCNVFVMQQIVKPLLLIWLTINGLIAFGLQSIYLSSYGLFPSALMG